MWLVATTASMTWFRCRMVQVRRGATSCSGHLPMPCGEGCNPRRLSRAQGHRLPLARSEGNTALLFPADC